MQAFKTQIFSKALTDNERSGQLAESLVVLRDTCQTMLDDPKKLDQMSDRELIDTFDGMKEAVAFFMSGLMVMDGSLGHILRAVTEAKERRPEEFGESNKE